MWKTLIRVYVYKLQVYILKKWLSFGVWTVENGHFSRCFLGFLLFNDFQVLSELGSSNSVLGSFSCSWRKTDLKWCIKPPKHKLYVWPFTDLLALNDLDLNPRPDGSLDFPPPDGGLLRLPPVTRLLDVVARNPKNAFEGSSEIITKVCQSIFR